MPFKSSTTSNTQALTRRSTLGGMAALSAAGMTGLGLGSSRASAAKKPITRVAFGSAAQIEPFRADPRYRKALLHYCDLIAPMNALKWATLRHTKGQFDFQAADELVQFAQQHGKTLHGHTLLWADYNPKWIETMTSKNEAEKVLVEHIETVVDHYRGKIPTWDVVNEVIAHDPREDGKWGKSLWFDHLGASHVDIAFRAAARADPTAKLIINDYDLGDWGTRFDLRRSHMLDIVRHLQDRNIPIHGVGFQAHLYAERKVGRKQLIKFVRDLMALGLTIQVSELDVIDWRLSADPGVRDYAVAQVADEFLDALFEGGTPEAIITWGLSDEYTWISDTFPRKDGNPNRPLPLDREYKEKPLMDVIKKYALLG